ncbi:hypothetical protein ABGB18_25215 [Nonomuraea sp. B12E4]
MEGRPGALDLRELLSGALADGTLRRTYGVWHFTGGYRPAAASAGF